jgi:hypothetical protein
MKKIAIDHGLEHLKAELQKRGYVVETADEITGGISAYIYNDLTLDDKDTEKTALKKILTAADKADSDYLLVRAGDKNTDEIIDIIEHRLYSPLF